MRSYARVAPTFWTGETGRALRRAGPDVALAALYLVTCPGGSMSGIYYLPVPVLCHETGFSKRRAREILATLEREEFAFYDLVSETVWVPEMARFQVGDRLAAGDKRILGFVRELSLVTGSPFVGQFFQRYREVFNLPEEGPWKALPRPIEGASEALLSQAQVHAHAPVPAQAGEQASSLESQGAAGPSVTPPGPAGGTRPVDIEARKRFLKAQADSIAAEKPGR